MGEVQRVRIVLSRRRFLYASGLTGAAFLLSACGDSGGETSGGAGSEAAGGESEATGSGVQSAITLGVNNPNYASQLPIYVALDQGFLEEVGFSDVEVVATEEYIPGLIGGSLNITQGDTDVLIAAAVESSEPITLLGTYRAREWRIVGVSGDIQSPEDLRGQAVSGGTLDDRNTFLLRQALTDLGLDPDNDVEFVPIGGNSDARLQALIAGQIKAASLFPRHEAQLVEAGGRFLSEELFDVPQESIAVMRPYLEENRESVVAYLTANIRARQYLQDLSLQDDVIAMMRENDFEIPPEFEPLYEIEIDQISADGGFEAEEMDEFVQTGIELEAIPEGTEWRDFVDLEPLWEAQEANGLPRRPDPSSI
jgi:ABC-type nitrate/sulfonate/bicarbonate transport system substrate-binding protein